MLRNLAYRIQSKHKPPKKKEMGVDSQPQLISCQLLAFSAYVLGFSESYEL